MYARWTLALGLAVCASVVSCSKNETPINPEAKKELSKEVAKEDVKKVDIQKALENRHEIERRGLTYDKDTFANAAKTGNREIVELFVKSGFDVHVKDSKGATVLEYAMERNDLELVNFILKSGYDINHNNNGTPLIYASGLGNLEIVKVLIDKGANISFQTPEGGTALYAAIVSVPRVENGKQVEILSLLISKGADVNARVKSSDGTSQNLLQIAHAAKMQNAASKVWDKYMRIISALENKPHPASTAQSDDMKCEFADAGFGVGAHIRNANGKNVVVKAELAKGDLADLTNVEAKIITCGYQQNPFGSGGFNTCWGHTNPPVFNQNAASNMEFNVNVPVPQTGDSMVDVVFQTKANDQNTYGKIVYRVCSRI